MTPAILAVLPLFGGPVAYIYQIVVSVIGAREVYRIDNGRASLVALFPQVLLFGILMMVFFAITVAVIKFLRRLSDRFLREMQEALNTARAVVQRDGFEGRNFIWRDHRHRPLIAGLRDARDGHDHQEGRASDSKLLQILHQHLRLQQPFFPQT